MRFSAMIPAAILVASLGAAPAAAASFISGPGAVSLDRADDFTWTLNFTATDGTQLPGTTGTITINFLSANAAGTSWNFSYTVDNTSTAPSTSSRLGVFGFDTSDTVATATATGASPRFSAALNGGNFNGLGNRSVCFYSGPNCNGSGNSGVTVPEAPVSGTFTLTFASGVQILILDDFVARWQATGGQANGSNSGPGLFVTVAPVPEPATWAMMIAGFGLVGGLVRRRPITLTA